MHIGSYDDEPATVASLDGFAIENGYIIDIGNTLKAPNVSKAIACLLWHGGAASGERANFAKEVLNYEQVLLSD